MSRQEKEKNQRYGQKVFIISKN